ncbi:hypothetical protein BU14_0142s0015 [Porphyra umbilicalis]|uniref:NADH:ubiquinone oxidoreductase intermediate-associated protein 30 domain-containing protein n=1 Tax=Porphyra umbilicalis TaxID=2786 RepID=A0A1X6PA46_PORUM|nr:hypothetical protein BU14_0142s0015 [Porphyra umbilicalis]|eukprot:OSX77605.1 hypothetical protein BU14_0142s0015 [Porphyra umbilicalis]
MGGTSTSTLRAVGGDGDDDGGRGPCALFSGTLRTANRGGFAQARARLDPPLNLNGYDGLALAVRGDGRDYKVNLKNGDVPEVTFQAQFRTAPDDGRWHRVSLPWAAFLPVRRGRLLHGDGAEAYGRSLDTTALSSVAVLCSKLSAGGLASPTFRAGPFALAVRAVTAYRDAPPVLLVASAAAAAGEAAVRGTGVPYAIVRATALVEGESPPRREVAMEQGDTAVGRLTRADMARVLVAAAGCPAAAWKTWEVRERVDRGGDAAQLAAAMRALQPDE